MPPCAPHGISPSDTCPRCLALQDADLIVNHVYIGRGPVKPSDLFNILTWVSLGATVNIYVANPDKEPDEEQHTYASLFNLKHVVDPEFAVGFDVGTNEFSAFRMVKGRAQGLANQVNLVDLHSVLTNHDSLVHPDVQKPTAGWKTGILKFLNEMTDWWPAGRWNDDVLYKLFSVIDATKYYLAATTLGLVCDMKVAPTKHLWPHAKILSENFISYQRGNAGATGFENQLSGSMCKEIKLRLSYAETGAPLASGFGSKSVAQNRDAFKYITARHGAAMQTLQKAGGGVHSNKLKAVVADFVAGWAGPVCVFKHPKDQSWLNKTLSPFEKGKAKSAFDVMARESLSLCRAKSRLSRELQADILKIMKQISELTFFNIYDKTPTRASILSGPVKVKPKKKAVWPPVK